MGIKLVTVSDAPQTSEENFKYFLKGNVGGKTGDMAD